MAVVFLLTIAAFLAYVPATALLFLVLDRYVPPRLPKSLFDERKVTIVFAPAIPMGIALGLIFLAYAYSLTSYDFGGATLWALVFVLVAALLRRVLVHTKTFGGVGGDDPLVPVHTFAYGTVSGATVGLALGFDLLGLNPNPSWTTYALLAGVTLDMIVVEAWAGLRFGRACRKGFSWTPPLTVVLAEIIALAALAVPFLLLGIYGAAALVAVFLVGSAALIDEEPRALGALRASAQEFEQPKPRAFGRVAKRPRPLPSEGTSGPKGSGEGEGGGEGSTSSSRTGDVGSPDP